MLKDGIYEELITNDLDKRLSEEERVVSTSPIDPEDASRILSKYVQALLERELDKLKGEDTLKSQIELANRAVSSIVGVENSDEIVWNMHISDRAEELLALFDKKNTIYALDDKREIIRPETSIANSSLFTGALYEPQMYTELKKEILTSDSIDMLVSFIKWSGLRLIIGELKSFTDRGGKLRVITTSYMGATDLKAIEELNRLLNTEIKISYDTKRTRLHAKTYVFYRNSGFTTSYVGSSNLSNAAISSGLEWNLKITKRDLPDTICKIAATFESYWASDEFESYSDDRKEQLRRALLSEKSQSSISYEGYGFDLRPYPFQQEILDSLMAERVVRGHYRNLIVAATGTGKTVISAFDFKRFLKSRGGRARLLFVAHREGILRQSLYTFRAVLKDENFGELFTSNYKPSSLDALFISIQSLNSSSLIRLTSPDYYDYIVVDEFHHAASPSYQELLEYYRPEVLLGLTATPERMDGKSILRYFDNRIAAEIRLPEAIERKLLSPFQYFGVTDSVDLRDVRWINGGYDRSELSRIYAFSGEISSRRADLIFNSVIKYTSDVESIKGLGFSVSVEHAEFMADYFSSRGIPSIALTGLSRHDERINGRNRLKSGEIKFIFAVDIYNEGVDIPEVNTVLFLRPTESLTVFLQQLGRGLRLSEGKECLTVLDFVGQANRKYNWEERLKALLFSQSHSVEREIKGGFVSSLPKGCYIELEKKAKEYILNNIREAYSGKNALLRMAESYEDERGEPITLKGFLDYYSIDIRLLYHYSSFSRLLVRAGLIQDFDEPLERAMENGFIRLSSINSRRLIKFLLGILPNLKSANLNNLSPLEKRMFKMFYVSLFDRCEDDFENESVKRNIDKIIKSPTLLSEIIELLRYNYDRIDFVDKSVDLGFSSPLDLYCSYSRDQILVSMDINEPQSMREGVRYFDDKKIDLFLITLNKSEKDYSESTRYEDYSINERLFHWQSQSTLRESSKTGQRYIHHRNLKTDVLLFVREYKRDPITKKASPYTFLGKARYVRHYGEEPMNIIWRLDEPIPAKYLKKTNRLLLG